MKMHNYVIIYTFHCTEVSILMLDQAPYSYVAIFMAAREALYIKFIVNI